MLPSKAKFRASSVQAKFRLPRFRRSQVKCQVFIRSASKFHESPRRSLPNPLIEFVSNDYIGTLRESPILHPISNESCQMKIQSVIAWRIDLIYWRNVCIIGCKMDLICKLTRSQFRETKAQSTLCKLLANIFTIFCDYFYYLLLRCTNDF